MILLINLVIWLQPLQRSRPGWPPPFFFSGGFRAS
jgi:hypothetical protein